MKVKDVNMRRLATLCLLVSIGFILLASSGCICSKTSHAIAEVVVAKAVAPPLELSISTMDFQRNNGRWPSDYTELRSLTATEGYASLSNYDRVDFIQMPDGSLAIFAVGPGMTNQMILSLPEKSQK